MIVGKIQYHNFEKKYGFIECEEYPKGVFFHLKDYDGSFDDLMVGDKVSFDASETQKGIAAKNVVLI